MAREILVSIKVDAGQAEARIGKVKQSTDEAKVSNDLYAQSFDKLSKSEQQALIQEQKLNIQRKETKLRVQELAAAQLRSAGANKSARAQAGLNNAILLETGRLASDASFGFTAIANNLSQVVSLTQSFIRTNGSAVESFKQLRDSLLGAGGVMIGIQLLISFLPKIAKLFSNTAKEVNKFQKAIDDATASLDTQIDLFERITENLSQYGNIGKLGADANFLLAGSFSEFKKALDAIDQGALLKFTDSFNEEVILSGAEATDELRNKFLQLLKVRREEAIVVARLQRVDEEGNLILRKNTEERERAEGRYITLLRERLQLEEIINIKVPKENGEKRLETDRQQSFELYKTRLSDFDKYAEKALKKEKEFGEMSAIQRLDIQKELALRELDIRATQEIENEKLRYQTYLNDIDLRKQDLLERVFEKEQELLLEAQTEEAKLEIKKSYNKRREAIEGEFSRAVDDASKKNIQILGTLAERFSQTAMSIADSYGNIQDTMVMQEDLDAVSSFAKLAIDGIQQRIDAEMNLSRSVFDRIELEKKLEESRHQEKLAFLREELRQAQINEENTSAIQQKIVNEENRNSQAKTSIAQKERDAKVALINQVADVAIMAAKEGSAVAKAVAVFAATVNTYEAVTAALGAKPYTPLNIAQAAAVGAMGFLQVRNIVNTPDPFGRTGDSQTSTPVIAPAFNVVGASPDSQLANVVAEGMEPTVVPVVFGSDLDDFINNRNVAQNAGSIG